MGLSYLAIAIFFSVLFLIYKQKATQETIWENEKLLQPFVVAPPLQQ